MAQFKSFAKLFEHPEYIQILAIRGFDEEIEKETVEVSVCTGYAGICVTVVSFGNEADADEAFEELGLEECLLLVKPIKEALQSLAKDG